VTGPIGVTGSSRTADPFGTSALRDAALAAWRGSATRLREDANLEEDHARGFYRDRVVVELAQNAADAAGAARTGAGGTVSGGRLDLRLEASGGVWWLIAENTGVPLTADGVASLASLRASTKSGPLASPSSSAPPSVGRFGVGFAAVRSVSDDVRVATRTPEGVAGVRFSLAATRDLLAAADDDLAARAAERGDALPVLRLPFPVTAEAVEALPSPWATTVVALALRDDDAVHAVRDQLAALDEVLLLALPSLDVVRVEVGGVARELDRAVFGADRGWHVVTAHGSVSGAALAERPAEERGDARWSVTWAVPYPPMDDTREDDRTRGVVHAPTPTSDPLALAGVLVATFPLDATRRHVVEGLFAREVADAAGRLFADVVTDLVRERGADALALVPVGVPVGWVDAAVRDAALEALRDAPLLDGVAPSAAVAIAGPVGADAQVVEALRPAVHGLVTVPPAARAVARRLGVQVRPLADVVDDLAPGLPPGGWRRVFAALAPHADDRDVREALATLPVPVAGPVAGTSAAGLVPDVVRGPRGVVAPGEPDDAHDGAPGAADEALDALRSWGVRVVHPDAAHPLLQRLGALTVDDPGVLDLPASRDAIAAAGEPDDERHDHPEAGPADEAAEAVLAVVQGVVRAHPQAVLPSALEAVLLPAVDRETGDPVTPQPGADLALPGSWAAEMLDLDLVDPDVADAWDPATFGALGVHVGLRVVTVHDVVLPGPDDDSPLSDEVLDRVGDDALDYLDDLAEQLGVGALVAELDLVAPLDAVPGREPAHFVDHAQDQPPDGAGSDPVVVARVLEHLLADAGLRAALLGRVRPQASGAGAGRRADGPSYLAWWLRRRLGSPLVAPSDGSASGSVLLAAIPDEVARAVRAASDPAPVWRALGVVSDLGELAALDDDVLADAFDRLPSAGTLVPLPDAAAWWRLVRVAASRGFVWDPSPERVVALVAGTSVPGHRAEDGVGVHAEVRAADDVRVASGPQAAVLGPVVPAARAEVDDVAEALDLDVAVDDVPPDVESSPGRQVDVPPVATVLLRALGHDAPTSYLEHDRLVVAGTEVEWWVEEPSLVHASTRHGLSRGLAWAAGDPGLRHLLGEVLAGPDRADELLAESAWD
jgi:hypothetical protein